MNFKYQDLMTSLGISEICPDKNSAPGDSPAFRFCKDPLGHEHNFLPNHIYRVLNGGKNPKRGLTKEDLIATCNDCCQSFFKTLNQIIAFALSYGGISKMKYTHIAGGRIDKTHGVISKPDSNGHFHLWDYENNDFLSYFTIVQPIPIQ